VQVVAVVGRVHASTGSLAVAVGPALPPLAYTAAYGDLIGVPTLGTAAAANTGDFATAAQGAKADTAVQPGALGNSAGLNVGTTTGTVAAGDDSRITGALSATAAAAAYQPLDSDLTSIAALNTTAFGRDLLTQADAAATRATIGAGTSNVAISSATPQPLGTAAAGATGQAADAGHVHASVPLVSTSTAGLVPETGTPSGKFFRDDGDWAHPQDVIVIPVGDESTALTTGTNKIRFRMPFAATLLAVRANVNTAPTGSTLIVDINEAGTTLLSTKLSVDASETTSTTAAVAAVISDSSLADDAEISIDIDQIGSTAAGAGLKVSLFVRRV
jgi:hypothetical protein